MTKSKHILTVGALKKIFEEEYTDDALVVMVIAQTETRCISVSPGHISGDEGRQKVFLYPPDKVLIKLSEKDGQELSDKLHARVK